MNRYALRAKWTRAKRKAAAPPRSEQVALIRRGDDIPMTLAQYFASHVHLGRLWAEHLWFETDWFVKSLRGELPPAKQLKNYTITHIYLPPNRYYLALEALSTRMGVKPQDAKPR